MEHLLNKYFIMHPDPKRLTSSYMISHKISENNIHTIIVYDIRVNIPKHITISESSSYITSFDVNYYNVVHNVAS